MGCMAYLLFLEHELICRLGLRMKLSKRQMGSMNKDKINARELLMSGKRGKDEMDEAGKVM